MLRTSWRLFLRTKRVFFPALLAGAGIAGFALYQGSLFRLHGDVLWFAGDLQQACGPLLLLELYLSYEFLASVRQSGLEETAAAIPWGKARLYAAPWAVLLCLAAVFFLAMEAACLLLGLLASAPGMYFPHTLAVNALNTLAAGALAVTVGGLLALCCKRLPAYALLALLGFWMLPVSDLVPGILSDGYHVNIWPAKAVFSWVLPPNTTWSMDYQYGISCEAWRWSLTGLWLCLALVALAGKLLRGRVRLAAAGACLAGFAGCLALAVQGDSLIDLTTSPTSVFRADDAYYGQHLQREEEPAFQIAVYDMDLALGRELRAAVTMDLEGPALSAYPFTLYHGYQVTRVTDENGAALPFTREGDYLTVTPAGPLPSLSVEYAGSSPMFYSGSQGACLPGCFPYYPWAGYRKIFYGEPGDETRLLAFIPRTDLPESEFAVKVTGGRNVQVSLPESDGAYRGRANGLSLMGGLLEARELGPYRLVTSPLAPPGYQATKEWLDQLQAAVTQEEERQGLSPVIQLSDYMLFQNNETLLNRAGYGLALVFSDHMFLRFGWDADSLAEEIVSQYYGPVNLSGEAELAELERQAIGQ